MTLSEKLQNLRKAAGLSQEQLAERLNVTRQAVSKWETGEGKPDIDNLLPLAKLLHTTVDYLLDDTADAPHTDTPPTPPQSESVGYELWEQLKAFGRRWGWLGGYAIAAVGAVRLVTTLIVVFAGGSMLGDIAGLGVTLGAMGSVIGATKDAVAPMMQLGAQAAAPAASGWNCSCGQQNITSNFCPNCGAKKPEIQSGWNCGCGLQNITSNFCTNCGAKKPDAGWICPDCGQKDIKTNFCPNCGHKRGE